MQRCPKGDGDYSGRFMGREGLVVPIHPFIQLGGWRGEIGAAVKQLATRHVPRGTDHLEIPDALAAGGKKKIRSTRY